jgi:hypothetical protein
MIATVTASKLSRKGCQNSRRGCGINESVACWRRDSLEALWIFPSPMNSSNFGAASANLPNLKSLLM